MEWIDGTVRPEHGQPAWVLLDHCGMTVAAWDAPGILWHSFTLTMPQHSVAAYSYLVMPAAPQMTAVLEVGPGLTTASRRWMEGLAVDQDDTPPPECLPSLPAPLVWRHNRLSLRWEIVAPAGEVVRSFEDSSLAHITSGAEGRQALEVAILRRLVEWRFARLTNV